jgi:hypothetical protein
MNISANPVGASLNSGGLSRKNLLKSAPNATGN